MSALNSSSQRQKICCVCKQNSLDSHEFITSYNEELLKIALEILNNVSESKNLEFREILSSHNADEYDIGYHSKCVWKFFAVDTEYSERPDAVESRAQPTRYFKIIKIQNFIVFSSRILNLNIFINYI